MKTTDLMLIRAIPQTAHYDDPPNPEVPPPNPEVPPPNPDPNKKPKVEFTPAQQQFINSQLAEERRKGEKKNNELIAQLETEKNKAHTTSEERAELQERIEKLQTDYVTKEELAKREASKKVTDLEQKLKDEQSAREAWQNRFVKNKKEVDLTQAAVGAKAFSPKQVVTILDPMTRLVEIKGEDGKPTGEFETRVKVASKDKEGKDVILDLTPTEAVKQLQEMPEEYGNLFISGANGGLGSGSLGNRQGQKKSLNDLSPAEYHAQRERDKQERLKAGRRQ